MNADETLFAEAERLGCSVVMVDDRPIPKDVRVEALMTQAHSFADAINRETGTSLATVDRRRKHMLGGTVWVRLGNRCLRGSGTTCVIAPAGACVPLRASPAGGQRLGAKSDVAWGA